VLRTIQSAAGRRLASSDWSTAAPDGRRDRSHQPTGRSTLPGAAGGRPSPHRLCPGHARRCQPHHHQARSGL